MIRIANTSAFWGDQESATKDLLEKAEVDYITLDYLAELSLSIMASQREKDPTKGFAQDFVAVIGDCCEAWKRGSNVKIVTNAGGLNSSACAKACQELLQKKGVAKKIAVVTGDAIESYAIDGKTVISANAYIGANAAANALSAGADVVIGGRIADPSMTVACGLAAFSWKTTNYSAIAGATVAGHLIECGTQACGGFSTDWLDIKDPTSMGFPIVELFEDGHFIVTKPQNTGGAVTVEAVKEQLLYEIFDPKNYLSPDATVDFSELHLCQEGPDRVSVSNAKGTPPPPNYKVNATFKAGYKVEGQLVIIGPKAIEKARNTGKIILERVTKCIRAPERSCVEVIGAGDISGIKPLYEPFEVALRIALYDSDKAVCERFSKEIAPLVTSGPQGITGYATGRPKVRPVFGFHPGLIPRERLNIGWEFV